MGGFYENCIYLFRTKILHLIASKKRGVKIYFIQKTKYQKKMKKIYFLIFLEKIFARVPPINDETNVPYEISAGLCKGEFWNQREPENFKCSK